MPVPAISPDNTVRWYLHYTTQEVAHVVMSRSTTTIDNVQASALFHGFLTALEPFLNEIIIIKLEMSIEGSNVRIPQEWTEDTVYGTGSPAPIDRPAQLTLTGKDTLGHRVRVGMFGVSGITDSNWRVSIGENAAVIGVLTSLIADTGFFLTIAGNVPFWNTYINYGANDHWVKKVRQGG